VTADLQPNRLRPRWRKVLSDLWGDKTRTALVVASIAVGVFAIGMIITTYVILAEDINRSYAAVNPPNIVVWTDPFDKDFVKAIAKVPGVTEVEGRRLVAIRARKGTDNWQALTLVGLTAVPGPINRLVPIEGAAVPGENEILISQDLLHVTGFHPGDRIEVELPGSSNRFLTVAGLVTDQTASLPDVSSTNNAFVTLKTLDGYGLGTYFNQLYLRVAGGTQLPPIVQVAAQIKDQVKDSQRTVYRLDEKLSNEHPMTSLVLAVMGLLGALGALITILSSSLIVNTLNALLAQQLRQIGIMKLVGARSFQILGMYLALILAYSLIALALAVPLGVLAGYAMAWTIATLLGAVLQGFRIVPVAIVAQVLLATLVPLGTSFFPINSGAKTKVQQAISNYRPGDQSAKRPWLNFNIEGIQWISRPLLLSFRNTFRKRGRVLLTLFTLTVAGAVFIAVFNVRDSMSHVISQVMDHFLGDVTVDFSQPYRVDQVEHALLGIPGVTGVEGWGGATGEIWDANDKVITRLSIVAPPQSTQLLHPDFVAGRWLLPHEPNALVISDSIYKLYPHLKPGDQLIVKIPGFKKEAWTVVGIFRFVSMLGDPIAYADFDVLADKVYLPKQAMSYRIVTQLHDATALQGLTQRINTFLKDRHYTVQSVRSGYSLRTNSTQAVDVLILFLLIMAALTAFVGSIGLTGTMSINVLERTREIGVMRTIGAVDRVVMQSVVIEALVIGLITWILAIGLSFPISFLLLKIIGEAIMGSALALTFTPLGIGLWLAGVIVLSVIASIVPARNAARLTINEVLAYE
jgi:putative ABC transport system permease protein